MIAIIILNWNGWGDTVECVKSIYDVNNIEFATLVVDNGSSNDSVARIKEYADGLNVRKVFVKEGDSLTDRINNRDLILYQLNNNYGFAKGNNKGLQLLASQEIDYFWILNNDTVVEPDSISVLKKFMDDNQEYSGCTPQIRYFSDKNKIWNCGGNLIWGFRKYYYADKYNVSSRKDCFDIGFVTGCALLIRKEALKSDGTLFTEKFFFGEEDFELSMRWKEEKKKISCCTNSLIYHKVSASTQSSNELPKIFIHYLNRYINIKQHFGTINYSIWKSVNNIWLMLLLIRKKYSVGVAISFVSKLNKESSVKECVDYDYFINTLKGKNI